MNIGIVGAGFSGAVVARELAEEGFNIAVFESRGHVAGNCHTERDVDTKVLLHKYGPHIFHTDNEEVYNYISKYGTLNPYINRVKITSQNRVFSLPINLLTINQFFNKTLSPNEAKEFMHTLSDKTIKEPKSFEEQAMKFVGKELYNAFFKGYTLKQWGVSPTELPATILKRLPIRFNYDDNYFNLKYQGMPINGYTPIVENILDHPNISTSLNTKFSKSMSDDFDHLFFTGPIDAWFDFKYGRLGYRTLDFKREVHEGDYQGCAVMNYGDQSIPYTRISEHKHFSPWESHEQTTIFKEYSRECTPDDTPYYPIRLVNEKAMLSTYIEKASQEQRVTFLGRLGTYRYLDMDVTIAEALNTAKTFIQKVKQQEKIPTFFVDPR